MIRPSSLSLARHCALAPVLSERYGHRNENTERGNAVDAQVTAELVDGVVAWDLDARACLDWIAENLGARELRAQKGVRLLDPDTGGLLTEGTPDLVAISSGITIVDYKKREQMLAGRLAAPDDNLQLHAYALAEALRLGAGAYTVILLLFGDGKVEALASQVYTPETWGPILDAIRRIQDQQEENPRATTGSHCLACYPRSHCPAWLLPAASGELEPLTKPGGLTVENRGRALLATIAMEELAEKAKELLKADVAANGPIVVGDRKWAPVLMPGRASVDSKALERDGLLSKYTKKGPPHTQHRWVKHDG